MFIHHSTSRRLLGALAAVGTVAALAACSPEATPSDGSSALTLTVGSDLTYPPYAALDGDTPIGFDPEIVGALAEELGAKLEIVDTRFEQLIPSLKAGQINLIASALYITAERAKEVDYVPYFSTGNSIVVLTGENDFADETELCGRAVGVIKGSAVGESLRGEASDACVAEGEDAIDVRDFTTDPEATQALLSGQLDAHVTDAAVAAGLLEEIGDRVEISSDSLLYPIPVGLAVAKGDDELRTQIESALAAMKASGAYQELLEAYNLEEPDQNQVDAALAG